MILHTDGRIEGTPEELARYQALKAGRPAGPFTIAPTAPYRRTVPMPQIWPPSMPLPDLIECGGVTYQGPELMLWNIDATAAKWPI